MTAQAKIECITPDQPPRSAAQAHIERRATAILPRSGTSHERREPELWPARQLWRTVRWPDLAARA